MARNDIAAEIACEQEGRHAVLSIDDLDLGGVSFYDLADHFSHQPDCALLDSRGDHGPLADFSFLSFAPFARVTARGGQTMLRMGQREIASNDDVFAVIRQLLASHRVVPVVDCYGIPFKGGAIGYFAFELARSLETLPQTTRDDLRLPDVYLCFYNFTIALHHRTRRMYLCHVAGDDRTEGLSTDAIIGELQKAKAGQYEPCSSLCATGALADDFTPDLTEAAYLEAVRRIKDYIYAGDVYQVNFTQRFRAHVGQLSPWALYKQLSSVNPAPFAAYLNCEGHAVVSSSPERYMRVDGRRVETRPIKGTIRRGAAADEETKNRVALFHSGKDRAELAMIVDLMRNDISRVCIPGSVQVCGFPQLETYPSLHHLAATITGALERHADVIDLIKATFPGGSISGAPKIRSLEIIDELEPVTRGVYTGSLGYIGFDGQADLNIAIRTLLCQDGVVHIQAGGGIVADSDEHEEYRESLLKASKLFEAVRCACRLPECG